MEDSNVVGLVGSNVSLGNLPTFEKEIGRRSLFIAKCPFSPFFDIMIYFHTARFGDVLMYILDFLHIPSLL